MKDAAILQLKGFLSGPGFFPREATIRKFRTVQAEGSRKVSREVEYYNLDAIISVATGSIPSVQLSSASGRRDFAIRGYVLDKERLKNGSIFNREYFDTLVDEIREIRAGERRFYQCGETRPSNPRVAQVPSVP